MVNSTNHIAWRWYLSGTLKTTTPLILGSGEDKNADTQCIRDGEGEFFIPGTTLAGILRHSLLENPAESSFASRAFGEARDDGRQSLLLFYDAPLLSVHKEQKERHSTIRDGVALDKITKTAEDKKKFDYEVIEREQIFRFRMEAILREKDFEENGTFASMKKLLDEISGMLTDGEMRIGAKRSRGFGRIVLENPRFTIFDFSDPLKRKAEGEQWLHFDWAEEQLELFTAASSKTPSEHISVHAAFDIPGTMFIRSYSTNPKAPDAVHIQSNNAPVIPGTSWAGALRHALFNLGRAMDTSRQMELLTKSLFGDVCEKANEAFASNIIVDESTIMDAQSLEYTRNKIDRFTGGVAPSALFTEEPSFGGTVELNCLIRKEFHKTNVAPPTAIPSPEACVGALLLAVLEIGNGIQPVGGAGAIGRGLLSLRSLRIDGENILNKSASSTPLVQESAGGYLRAAAEYLGRK